MKTRYKATLRTDNGKKIIAQTEFMACDDAEVRLMVREWVIEHIPIDRPSALQVLDPKGVDVFPRRFWRSDRAQSPGNDSQTAPSDNRQKTG